MLPGYCITEEGLIKHLDAPNFTYDTTYAEDRYTEKKFVKIEDRVNAGTLDGMRLGYLIAANKGILPSSILDIGYGSGSFLKLCSRLIPDCYGYDVSGYPLPEGVSKLETLTEKTVDWVTMFDSIEHMPDLDFLSKLGTQNILISVPWCHYWNVREPDKWMKEWRHLRPNGEHLWHGDYFAWSELFKKHGFSPIFQASFFEDFIRTRQYGDLPNILTIAFTKNV